MLERAVPLPRPPAVWRRVGKPAVYGIARTAGLVDLLRWVNRRRVAILHDGDPDIAETRIAAVGLLAREIAARNDPQTSLAP